MVSLPINRSSRKFTWLSWLAGLFALVVSVMAQERLTTTDPNKVKAAYLPNFARYVRWPTNAFPTARSPWRIGVLGEDPFGELLAATVKDRQESGRGFEVHRAPTLAELPPCHILYIAIEDTAARQGILTALRGQPILTAGDAGGFLKEGGMIRLRLQKDKIVMDINHDQARGSGLSIDSRMLKLAQEVITDGQTIRQKR